MGEAAKIQKPDFTPEEKQERAPDDLDLAIDLVERFEDKVRFFFEDYRVYENGVWNIRAKREVYTYVANFLTAYRHKGVKVTANRVESVLRLAEGRLFKPDRELLEIAEDRKRFINLKNGLYDIENHWLEPHRPDLYYTKQLSFKYESKAACPNFDRLLATSLVDEQARPDEEMIMLMLEFMGYCLTSRTDLKVAAWLWGKPDSGKSTIVAVIRYLAGPTHVTIDLNQLGNRFLLSILLGILVATCTEAGANTMLPDDLFKTLVGGQDEIYTDVKNKSGIAFKPEAKLVWAMNQAPRTKDRSGAVLNRIRPILFNRTIPPENRIYNLNELLQRELPGIFLRVMRTYSHMVKRGSMTMPKQSIAWLEGYRVKNDTVLFFINERCERGEGYETQSEALYQKYKEFCEDMNLKPLSGNQIADEWEQKGLRKRRKNDANYWCGIRLKPTNPF